MQTSSTSQTPQGQREGSSEKRSQVPIVEVEHLRKAYQRLLAVDDISFVTYRGEAFGFLGPNGAGKSTVVKILTGLVAPTQGTVRLLGQPLGNRKVRQRIGYLPEFPTFHRWLTAKDFLEFHGRLYGMQGNELAQRSKEVMEMVGLSGREPQKLGTFSKGMLQRIGLAQALLNKPELLILDELVSGLDPVGQRDMRELLQYLKSEGTSIFFNSHQLADVEAMCDRIAIINQGRILKIGTSSELFGIQHVLELRVDAISDELLRQIALIAPAIEHVKDDPRSLLIEIKDDEQAAEIAATVHNCGARLYAMAPHRRSLEQLFFSTIETLRETTETDTKGSSSWE